MCVCEELHGSFQSHIAFLGLRLCKSELCLKAEEIDTKKAEACLELSKSGVVRLKTSFMDVMASVLHHQGSQPTVRVSHGPFTETT